MSKHIGDLKVGDTLEIKGPIPKWPYKPNVKKHIGMVAGGTGITPMLQVRAGGHRGKGGEGRRGRGGQRRGCATRAAGRGEGAAPRGQLRRRR